MQGERGRMLLRGRLTLAALGAALALALLSWLRPSPALEPPVAVADASEAEGAPDALVPAEVLGRMPVTRERVEALLAAAPASASGVRHLVEILPTPASRPDLATPLRVDYALDAELSLAIHDILRRGRVALGHAIVLDPTSGRVLAYASTDPERFPPDRTYPAASLVKVITAAAALHHAPEVEQETCRFQGNPWRLTRKRVDPPRAGTEVSLSRALATSNNQCFAQLAVHRVGGRNLLGAIDRFGWLSSPAPVHPPGAAELSEDPYELGKLGSGLAGSRITPLHAALLAATLAEGRRVEPWWIAHVTDGAGRELTLPRRPPQQVLTGSLARELREMLVETTERGTARRAFRTRRGPLLGPVRVAGKTGSLSGTEPDGRYEWFVGLAPAEAPSLALAVVQVQAPLYWTTPSQVAAEILKVAFCPKGVCRAEAVSAWLEPPRPPSAAGDAGRLADGR